MLACSLWASVRISGPVNKTILHVAAAAGDHLPGGPAGLQLINATFSIHRNFYHNDLISIF